MVEVFADHAGAYRMKTLLCLMLFLPACHAQQKLSTPVTILPTPDGLTAATLHIQAADHTDNVIIGFHAPGILATYKNQKPGDKNSINFDGGTIYELAQDVGAKTVWFIADDGSGHGTFGLSDGSGTGGLDSNGALMLCSASGLGLCRWSNSASNSTVSILGNVGITAAAGATSTQMLNTGVFTMTRSGLDVITLNSSTGFPVVTLSSAGSPVVKLDSNSIDGSLGANFEYRLLANNAGQGGAVQLYNGGSLRSDITAGRGMTLYSTGGFALLDVSLATATTAIYNSVNTNSIKLDGNNEIFRTSGGLNQLTLSGIAGLGGLIGVYDAAGVQQIGISGLGGITNFVGYSANGSAGVTCSGAPTGSFASIKGIVTHC